MVSPARSPAEYWVAAKAEGTYVTTTSDKEKLGQQK